MAGWDMVIFEGKSAQAGLPAITTTGRAARRGHLWGKTRLETEETLKKQHQDPQMRVSPSAPPARTRCCSPRWSTTCTAPPGVRASAR